MSVMENRTPEKARWDAQELEYKRIDDALRARMNFTLTRNVFAVQSNPSTLLNIAELDRDVWDNLLPAFQEDERRKKVDDGVDFLASEGNRLFGLLVARKNVIAEDITRFFTMERETFRLMNDMRYEKGMGIGLRREWTKDDEEKATGVYIRGGQRKTTNEGVGH